MSFTSPEIRDWAIYKITSPTNRVYVGLTKNLPQRLWFYRQIRCNKQTLIYNSLKKYGWDAHRMDVIDVFSSNLSYANGKEIFWVRSHMSNYHKFPNQRGMNLNDGGGSNLGHKMSEDQKLKISQSNKGRKVSEDGRRRMAIAAKGRNAGTKKTQEWKDKMSLAKIGKHRSEEVKRKISETRKRLQIQSPMKGVRLSQERRIQIGLSKVGNKNMLGKKLSQQSKDKIALARMGQPAHNRKSVFQYNEDGIVINEFPSISAVQKSLDLSLYMVNRILKGIDNKYYLKYK